MPDARELPMVTFRKVRAGWYTLAIVSWEEHFAQIKAGVPEHERKHEEHVDVSREKGGERWVVSIRGGKDWKSKVHELNQWSLFRATFDTVSDAKRYAVALKAYLQDKGPHPDYLQEVFMAEWKAREDAAFVAKYGITFDEYCAKIGVKA